MKVAPPVVDRPPVIKTPAALARQVVALLDEAGLDDAVEMSGRAADHHRRLVAIAGAPGSGKTTLAEDLAARLPHSVVVPMDGFHLDNALLDAAGLRAVKGAPETFDCAGFASLLERLGTQPGPVYVPLFDRAADLSRAAAASVTDEHRIVILEGNYLLLRGSPWSRLHALFDLTVLVDVDESVLRKRLVQRWLDHGHDQAAAVARAESNDLPNGRRVMRDSIRPGIRYRA